MRGGGFCLFGVNSECAGRRRRRPHILTSSLAAVIAKRQETASLIAASWCSKPRWRTPGAHAHTATSKKLHMLLDLHYGAGRVALSYVGKKNKQTIWVVIVKKVHKLNSAIFLLLLLFFPCCEIQLEAIYWFVLGFSPRLPAGAKSSTR